MSSSSIKMFFVIVLAVIVTDILCTDVTNALRDNVWKTVEKNQNNSIYNPIWGPNSKSTTPWPALGQKKHINNDQKSTNNNKPTMWVQRSNIWVKNPLGITTTGINTVAPTPSNNKKDINVIGPKPVHENTNNYPDTKRKNSGDVTDDELRDFSEKLLTKDINNVAQHLTVNYQGITTSRSAKDEAPLPLLSVNKEVYKTPSIEKMMVLYNNYIVESNQNEVYTAQEKIEENEFLDTILPTPVMQYTRNFLISAGKLGKDPKEFKDLMRTIWFNMYSRGQGRIGSSGFEHVFLAEIKNNQVSGLHNWLYFNEEEANARANYLGYLKKITIGNKGVLLKYHFTFRGVDKPVGSMFIGTSPELEMALYSTCFVLRADKICPLMLDGKRFIIRTYTYRYRGKNMIGSAFPEI